MTEAIKHTYEAQITWTGNLGTGTSSYTAYGRDFDLKLVNKTVMACSADPYFRGDGKKMNPEEMLLAALSSCHMLWYLHFCADAGIVVKKYADDASGFMVEGSDSGRFIEVVLRPTIEIGDEMKIKLAVALHEKAHKNCFIANSVNFPVRFEPMIKAVR